jgi:hypothetical protein
MQALSQIHKPANMVEVYHRPQSCAGSCSWYCVLLTYMLCLCLDSNQFDLVHLTQQHAWATFYKSPPWYNTDECCARATCHRAELSS